MGVGEDPVGEDGMDIDAPAWPPAGVEAADEGVIREGDPGDFYMKVIAKKFRGVWHYGVITGVVTECVLEDYGGATQWRAVFEDGDTVDLLRSEVVEAAQEHPPVDADGEARLVTVHEGDYLFAQQINRMKAHRLYREPNPNKKGYMASEDAGPGAVETPIRLVGSASAAWEDAVDFKDHLEKLLDDVRRTVQGSHSYAPILAGWGAVLPGWTPAVALGAPGLQGGVASQRRQAPASPGGGGGGDGETSRDNSFVYKMLKQVPDADPPPYTTEELESEEELPRNLLAEREDAKYTTMVARAQHFYLATPPPPPGADSDDSRASARPIRAALCTVWTPERAHTAVGLDVWRVPGGGGGSGGEEALVLLDAPSHRYRRRHLTPAALTTNRHVSFGRRFIRVGASAGLGVCRRQSCEAMDTTSPPGQKWAASLVVSRVRAAGIEEDEKDMRKRVTRFVRERRKANLNPKASTVPAAQLVVAEEAAASAAWRRNDCGLLWASGHRGRPDAKVRKLMAASSTAQPPGVVKTLTDDKKRKRPVKKRRGKKLTVAESEAESEAQAEAEAARSSKRRVPRARKNKNKQ
eukprot:jgi/Tetstr1/428512/TSEL_018523.t1